MENKLIELSKKEMRQINGGSRFMWAAGYLYEASKDLYKKYLLTYDPALGGRMRMS